MVGKWQGKTITFFPFQSGLWHAMVHLTGHLLRVGHAGCSLSCLGKCLRRGMQFCVMGDGAPPLKHGELSDSQRDCFFWVPTCETRETRRVAISGCLQFSKHVPHVKKNSCEEEYTFYPVLNKDWQTYVSYVAKNSTFLILPGNDKDPTNTSELPLVLAAWPYLLQLPPTKMLQLRWPRNFMCWILPEVANIQNDHWNSGFSH